MFHTGLYFEFTRQTFLKSYRVSVAVCEPEPQTFVQHSVGRLVPSQRLFGQVLVGLCQAFHLSETSVESHGRVSGILGHI